jgi:hypothetical protein
MTEYTPSDIEKEDEEPVELNPTEIDDDWRKAELEKMMLGDEEKSSAGKVVLGIAFVLVVGILGWVVFGPSAPPPPAPVKAASVEPPAPRKPPPPPPPPKPYKDLFEIQTQFDGSEYIVYAIQPGDSLFRIGEILHDVTGLPRLITHQAVEDAYWGKYFSYEEQNEEVVTDPIVQEHVGELLQIPVPMPEYPEYDLASKVLEYNNS